MMMMMMRRRRTADKSAGVERRQYNVCM